MRVLAINCGSSTLKFLLVDTGNGRRLAWGSVERIGGEASARFASAQGGGSAEGTRVEAPDHGAAARVVLDWLGPASDGVDAVGHRVVHGGSQYLEPTIVDDGVLAAVQEASVLAPLHNAPALAALRASLEALPSTPMAAVFDTAFHRTLPPAAAAYAIPPELTERHGIRRYGFHGLAHRSMAERYAELTSRDPARTRLITMQLGSGCSATAIAGGTPVETSMGFSPLEGLVMGTRSGDVDPSLPAYLARREGVDAATVEHWLNRRSGLAGVSGGESDMRNLLDAARRGDARAALAVDMFCHRARKYVGAYMMVLGGADAVVFGGGIGENSPEVRERICAGMEWCGLVLDGERNARTSEGCITADGSTVEGFVVEVDEEILIARDTAALLEQQG